MLSVLEREIDTAKWFVGEPMDQERRSMLFPSDIVVKVECCRPCVPYHNGTVGCYGESVDAVVKVSK